MLFIKNDCSPISRQIGGFVRKTDFRKNEDFMDCFQLLCFKLFYLLLRVVFNGKWRSVGIKPGDYGVWVRTRNHQDICWGLKLLSALPGLGYEIHFSCFVNRTLSTQFLVDPIKCLAIICPFMYACNGCNRSYSTIKQATISEERFLILVLVVLSHFMVTTYLYIIFLFCWPANKFTITCM